MKSHTVFAYLPEQSAGSLAGHLACFDDHAVFTYDPNVLDSACALPVDPVHFPLTDQPVPFSTGIMGGFRDASPDHWGRSVMDAARRQNGATEWDYFAEPSAWRIGFIEVHHHENQQALRLSYLKEILCMAECIEREAPILEQDFCSLFVRGSCVGGARLKVSLVDDDKAWIAKLPSVHDTFNFEML